MLRSAVTASSRTLRRLAASSARPSVFHLPLVSTSCSGPPIPALLPSASVLRFPSDFSRGYAHGRPALSSSEDDDDDDDIDDDSDDGGMGTDEDFVDDDEEIDSDEFSD